MEGNSPSMLKDETPQTPNSVSKIEYKFCNGSDKECVSPTAKFTKKETLKVQKKKLQTGEEKSYQTTLQCSEGSQRSDHSGLVEDSWDPEELDQAVVCSETWSAVDL